MSQSKIVELKAINTHIKKWLAVEQSSTIKMMIDSLRNKRDTILRRGVCYA